MEIELKNITQSLNKAYLAQSLAVKDVDRFQKIYAHLLKSVAHNDSEETLKDYINRFLNDTYYKNRYAVKENENNIDLVIKNGEKATDKTAVIIETKALKNTAEMITADDINRKALHEAMLYFMHERLQNNNAELKHIIITNALEWFIFDAAEFERLFVKNTSFLNDYNKWQQGKLVSKNKDWFYSELAKPFVEKSEENIAGTYFQLPESLELSESTWIELYKVFSPEHLLKLPFLNDSNTLNTDFYNELLHLLGLHEVTRKNVTKIERLPTAKRLNASLLENAIQVLEANDMLFQMDEPERFGETRDEQLFSIGLELVIIWLNRILFLKLLESQLVKFNKADTSFDYRFLNINTIHDFDELNELFFEVLAIEPHLRTKTLQEKYPHIPYLNSSLFEANEVERETLRINQLKSRKELPVFGATVLKDRNGKRISGNRPLLHYIFDFLDSYNFASDHKAEIQPTAKTIINSAVLGLIFEKINGYQEGSHFTPGFITMYMSREILRKAVIQKFRPVLKLSQSSELSESWIELYNKIGQISIKEANEIINSLKICDPSVGSGHFLVSVLNELIAIKADLKILADENSRILRDVHIEVENDELFVSIDGEVFAYNYKNPESRRIQKTLFHEKQTLIENCLFGVDINPKSANISRLRLWIELLKNTYYLPEGGLQTLPNIDINIKTGNSLISHFALNGNGNGNGKKQSLKAYTKKYKQVVADYKNTYNREAKHKLERFIDEQKENFSRTVNPNDEDLREIRKIESEMGTMPMFFSRDDQIQWQEKVERLQKELDELKKKYEQKLKTVYRNAFEWRFEFPEVLDDNGKFSGFDIVIGNPPYIRRTEIYPKFKPYYQTNYKSAYKQYDLYILFIEKGFELLKQNGILGFINPKFFVNEYGKVLRKLILDNYSILQIVDVGQFNIFNKASTYPSINIFSKHSDKNNLIKYFSNKQIKISEKIVVEKPRYYKQTNFYNNANYEYVFNGSEYDEKILKKIENKSQKIKTIYHCQRGLPNDKIIFTKRGQFFGIKSYHTKRYYIEKKNEKINFKNEIIEEKFSRIFAEELILLPRTVLKLTASLKNDNRIILDRIYFLKKKTERFDNKFILGLLNSTLINFWFEIHYNSTKVRGNYFDLRGTQIENIPVKIVSKPHQKPIIKLVDKILKQKEKDPESDTSKIEKQIDSEVYKLYGLSEEEIKVVENEATETI